ncbi:YceD family protein [Bacillus taeanensis]|uniref:DUF177 domain-containing protein n=1 Tax=Bacillus taeanensis TaxID=273032 RepID=A0A366XYK7_9BACI|nr:YceD family protein [Bacillus taeanensis]RBW70225.1 DUF177 domain-containing protein [Bacillus taeanensis]
MKWSIEQLKRLKAQGIKLDETVDVNDLTKVNRDIRSISPIHITGEADFYSNAVSFRLQIVGSMILPCSKTLVDVDFPFSIQTIETFQLESGNVEWEEEADEQIHQVEGNTVDLLPAIKESILLEVPMRVVSPNAEAAQSGKGWEVVSEKQKKDQVDPRLADLAKFFEKNENR